jgi:small subunit ribosomal protein S3e
MFAEINELLARELTDAGYAGVEIRAAPLKTEIVIRASKPQVRRIRLCGCV